MLTASQLPSSTAWHPSFVPVTFQPSYFLFRLSILSKEYQIHILKQVWCFFKKRKKNKKKRNSLTDRAQTWNTWSPLGNLMDGLSCHFKHPLYVPNPVERLFHVSSWYLVEEMKMTNPSIAFHDVLHIKNSKIRISHQQNKGLVYFFCHLKIGGLCFNTFLSYKTKIQAKDHLFLSSLLIAQRCY